MQGNTTEGDVVEVTFWHGYSTAISEQLDIMVEEYNANNPGVVIKPEFVASSEEILTKVQAAIQSNTQPDMLWGAPTMTGVLKSTGKLVNVMDHVDEDWKNDIASGLWDVGAYEGSIYSVPIEAGTLLLIYNKDMFEAAGITEVPTTWEGLYETSKALTNEEHKGIWLPIDPNERTTWTWLCYLYQNGATLLTEDMTTVGFDRETLVETLTAYTNVITDGYTVIGAAQDAFAEKSAAMIIGTQGAATSYINKFGINTGVAMLPGNEELATGLGTNQYFVFNNDDRKVEEAMKFIKWMTTGEQNAKWAQAAGYLPVSTTGKESESFQTYVETMPHFQIAADALEHGFARPSIEEYPSISNEISGAIEEIAYGAMSVEEAADQILAEIPKILEK